MRVLITAFTIAAATFALAPPAAFAQDGRVGLSASVGGAFGAGDSSTALNVAGGVHLARHAGIEAELLYLPSQRFQTRESFVPQLFPTPPASTATTSGRTVAVLGSYVASVSFGRLRPYAQVGGGIANVEYRLRSGGVSGSTDRSLDPVIGPSTPISENAPALSVGGGAEVRLWRRLAVGADVRYLRLFTTDEGVNTRNLTRLGLRLGYWF